MILRWLQEYLEDMTSIEVLVAAGISTILSIILVWLLWTIVH